MEEIEVIVNDLSKKYGVDVFFDDSRMWTLGYKDEDGCHGVQRPYLGGGVRGAIRSNLEGQKFEDFRSALLDIEQKLGTKYWCVIIKRG